MRISQFLRNINHTHGAIKSIILDLPVITSGSNANIKLLRSLETRKFRDKHNLIRVDGHRQIIDALSSSKMEPKFILLTEKAIEAPLGKDLMRVMANGGIGIGSVSMVTSQVLNSAIPDVNSPMVSAAFFRPKNAITLDGKGKRELIVILDKLGDPGNVGSIIRAACGLGATSVVTIDGTSDCFSPKALRSAVGSTFFIPVHETKWSEYLPQLQLRNPFDDHEDDLQILVAENTDGAIPYTDIDFTKRTAIIIGNEAVGPSHQAQKAATSKIYIPMQRNQDSLNASSAASIILAEAARQRHPNKKNKG
jgi:RNA methyltransferase, TrmH family